MDFDIVNEVITPLNTTLLTFSSTGAVGLPSGTTVQRPGTAAAGALRWNSSLTLLEYYNGTSWVSGSGSVTSVAISGGTTGLTTTGGPITTSGTITLGGTLGIANGGTGQTTATAAFDALSPTTTTGDTIYYNGTDNVRLAIGTTGQVLTVASGIPSWATVGAASYSVNVGPSGSISWSLISGSTYSAVITHNLGTQNVVVQMADISTNNVVLPDLITITSASQITIRVSGTSVSTRTLRVVVIANGASIAAGASTPSSIIVQNSGVALSGTFTTVNFANGLTATDSGSGVASISGAAIRALSFYATSLDSPNNSNWAVNALAATIADPTNNSINVRQYSNTVEQGVGLTLSIPSNATNIIFTYQGRAQTAPGSAATLQLKLYSKTIASVTPAAVGTWSAGTNLTSVTVPTNAFYQTYTQSSSLVSLSLTAGNLYQFEITRNISVAGNLASNWLLVGLTISFT